MKKNRRREKEITNRLIKCAHAGTRKSFSELGQVDKASSETIQRLPGKPGRKRHASFKFGIISNRGKTTPSEGIGSVQSKINEPKPSGANKKKKRFRYQIPIRDPNAGNKPSECRALRVRKWGSLPDQTDLEGRGAKKKKRNRETAEKNGGNSRKSNVRKNRKDEAFVTRRSWGKLGGPDERASG